MGLLLQDLKKKYVGPDGSVVPVVDIPQLYIEDGAQLALIGTSGSGKTTLLHLIAGILAPDSGHVVFGYDPALARAVEAKPATVDYASAPVEVNGVDLAALTEAQRDEFRGRHIGYIFQTHHLLPGFTALENVMLGMTFSGRHHDREWAEHLLREVGLADRIGYKPAKLSLGQQQRVAVARALANRPRLVLADEPTGSLDASNAQQVLDLIRKLGAEVGAMLVLVSHDMDIARQLPQVVTLAELNRATASATR